jgi:hypothetical protein
MLRAATFLLFFGYLGFVVACGSGGANAGDTGGTTASSGVDAMDRAVR